MTGLRPSRWRIFLLERGLVKPRRWEVIALSRALGTNPLWLAFGEEPEEIGEAERPFYEARFDERTRLET